MNDASAAGSIERSRAIFRSTLTALAQPRRFVAILVVVLPLLAVQVTYSRDILALPLAIAMCGAFVLVAPTVWRYFFPISGPKQNGPLGIAVYGFSGVALIVGIGRGVPALAGTGYTFLTTRPSLLVCLALFWVGGWGLARDIDLELDLKRERERGEALAREAEHAQLLALKSHLDPHFLFNTLNAIAEWCRSDGAVAERAILQLSDMLRTVMSGISKTEWSLTREIDLTNTLFSLYLIRDPELFEFERDIPADLPELSVPSMILLPISENAMKHGPTAGHRGKVRLSVRAKNGTLAIDLENPGAYDGPRDGGSGLDIVTKRLTLAYGDRAAFTIEKAGEDRTIAKLRIPIDERNEKKERR